jgi:hypothetical protein
MKTLTKYQCEKCLKEYLSPEEALNCEQKEKEIPLCNIGDIVSYRDDWNGGMGTSYIYNLIVYEINDYGHYLEYKLGVEYKLPNGEITYTYCESVDGNEEFIDKCVLC